MHIKAGLWIDQNTAVVVTVGGEDVVVEQIKSHPWESARLDRFFDAVEKRIGEAEQVFVMGPGEGKGKFVRHLQHVTSMRGCIAGIESRDTMTEDQVVKAVKVFYGCPENCKE